MVDSKYCTKVNYSIYMLANRYQTNDWFVQGAKTTLQAQRRGGVAQWVARLTRDRWIPVSREFEPYQRPLLFP